MDCSASRTRATPSRESTPAHHRTIRRAVYLRLSRPWPIQRKLRGRVAGKRHRFMEIAKRGSFRSSFFSVASPQPIDLFHGTTFWRRPFPVIPAKAGIHCANASDLDSRLRRNDRKAGFAMSEVTPPMCWRAAAMARSPHWRLSCHRPTQLAAASSAGDVRPSGEITVEYHANAQRALSEVHFAPSLAPSFVVAPKPSPGAGPQSPWA
jgi:hypothetical protein